MAAVKGINLAPNTTDYWWVFEKCVLRQIGTVSNFTQYKDNMQAHFYT